MSLQASEGMPRVRLRTARDVVQAQREYLWNAKGVSSDRDLSTTDLVVLNKLLMHADSDGETNVRALRIARDTKLAERTVRGSLAKLRRYGLVAISTRPTRTGRANVYILQRGPQRPTSTTRDVAHVVAVESSPTHVADDSAVATQEAASFASPEECLATAADEQELASPTTAATDGSCIPCSTHAATAAGSPLAYPSSERIKVNDPPLSPPEGGAPRIPDSVGNRTVDRVVDDAVVTRVLEHFLATLWPNNVGPPVDRLRRRLVSARLRELCRGERAGEAERILRDAVLGARVHSWHRAEQHRQQARFIFRDLDKVEELARLGRAKRLSMARETPKGGGEAGCDFKQPAGDVRGSAADRRLRTEYDFNFAAAFTGPTTVTRAA